MDKQAMLDELRNVIIEYLSGQNLELVDIILRYEGRDLSLRLLVDTPEGGISLDECARINREVGFMLDEKNIIDRQYTLEVSSPGLDRPLKTRSDFLRSLNRKAHFFLSEPVEGKVEVEGKVMKAEENNVFIEIEGNRVMLPLEKIRFAKRIVE